MAWDERNFLNALEEQGSASASTRLSHYERVHTWAVLWTSPGCSVPEITATGRPQISHSLIFIQQETVPRPLREARCALRGREAPSACHRVHWHNRRLPHGATYQLNTKSAARSGFGTGAHIDRYSAVGANLTSSEYVINSKEHGYLEIYNANKKLIIPSKKQRNNNRNFWEELITYSL
jgi:hypothetical protein